MRSAIRFVRYLHIYDLDFHWDCEVSFVFGNFVLIFLLLLVLAGRKASFISLE